MTEPTPTEDKDVGGRPTKLTEEFLATMVEVITDEDNALIYTDAELLFLINDRLPPEARVHHDTFSLWKNGRISDDVRAQRFFSVYTRALLKQKKNLFVKIDSEKNDRWQKDAWKIERKFDDWNIKQKINVTSQPKDPAAELLGALLAEPDGSALGAPTASAPGERGQ